MSRPPALWSLRPHLWSVISKLPPPLLNSSHKGECGKVGVMGGSKAYTGAPYFAAMAGMLMGVDLATVFCSVEAGIPIKAYAPDLMVRPCLYPEHMVETAVRELEAQKPQKEGEKREGDSSSHAVSLIVDDLLEWTGRLDSMVVGPGLGKDPLMVRTVAAWLRAVKDEGKLGALVVDGDGIHVLLEHPDLLVDHSASSTTGTFAATKPSLVLTPNAMEFRRLWQKFMQEPPPDFDLPLEEHAELLKKMGDGGQLPIDHPLVKDTATLARTLGGVTICRKGSIDVISNGQVAVACSATGCPKRVGGQGDVLAGACGVCLAWTRMATDPETRKKMKQPVMEMPEGIPPTVLGVYAASLVCRAVQKRAFEHSKRSLLPSHLLDHLPIVMQDMFPVSKV